MVRLNVPERIAYQGQKRIEKRPEKDREKARKG
jgi:hypothetical protein